MIRTRTQAQQGVSCAKHVQRETCAGSQLARYYVVVDFEATCWEGGQVAMQQEIIEFPVVLLHAASGTCAGEFHSFVRPTVHSQLSKYCQHLTGISQSTVDTAPSFGDVAKDFLSWLEEKTSRAKVAWVADGEWDLEDWCKNRIARSIRHIKLKHSEIPERSLHLCLHR